MQEDDQGSRTEEVIGYLLAGTVVTLTTFRIWSHLIQPGTRVFGNRNDLHGHIAVADGFSLRPLRIPAQQFGFHVSTRLLGSTFGIDTGAVIVLVLTSFVLGVSIAWWARSSRCGARRLTWPATFIFIATVLLYDSPAAVWKLRDIAATGGYIPIHVWDSPTEMSGLGLEVALLVAVLTLLDEDQSGASCTMHVRRVARWLPVLTIVATVFRPSLTIVMCAGLPIFLILRRRLRWKSIKDPFWRFWLPGVAMLALELAIAKTDSRLSSRSSVVIDPLGVFDLSNGSGPSSWMYWTTLAVIPAAAIVSGRRWYRDRAVQLTACCLLAGLVPTLLVVQVGAEANDGNIAKLALIGLIMLTFASLRTMVDTTGSLIATPAPISIGSWARVITGWSVVWLGMLGGIVIVLYVSGFS